MKNFNKSKLFSLTPFLLLVIIPAGRYLLGKHLKKLEDKEAEKNKKK